MFGLLFALVGIFNIYLSSKFLIDKKFAENYTKKSPKAALWRKLLGEEKALKLIKNIFAPLGIIMGIIFIVGGLYIAYIELVQ
jgi:hypothetical protein